MLYTRKWFRANLKQSNIIFVCVWTGAVGNSLVYSFYGVSNFFVSSNDHDHRLKILRMNLGLSHLTKLKYFSTNMIPSVEWRLTVSSVTPLQGSLRGGTMLTIVGDGFSTNKTRNSVMVGSHICEIESATVNELKCQIKDTAKVHVVDNSGIHPCKSSQILSKFFS